MKLPAEYRWLSDEDGPRILLEMLKLYGTIETPGPGNNPLILKWATSIGYGNVYNRDEIPWCGLVIAYAAQQAGWDVPLNPLWARNWLKWGTPTSPAMLGDVLVFPRGQGGHVAFYVGEDKTHYHILGGNQSDKVCIVRRAKKPILAIRQAPWRVAQPPNVRKVMLSASGTPTGGSEA